MQDSTYINLQHQAPETNSDFIMNTTNSAMTSNGTVYCEIFADDPKKCVVIIVMRSILAALSIVACLIVIFSIWLFKRYRYFSQRMLLYLAVAAALDALFRLFDLIPGPFACRFVAYLKTMSGWWIILLILVITANLLANLYAKYTSQHEWVYVSVCFGLPFVYAILPLFDQKYGPAGVWCWIVQDTAWRFAMWYGPLFVILPIIAFIYAFIIIKKKSLIEKWSRTYNPAEEATKEALKEDIRTLMLYPFIFIVLHLPSSIYRIHDAANPNDPSFALMFIAAICVATQGSINAMAFFFDKQTRLHINKPDLQKAWFSHFSKRPAVRSYSVGSAEMEHRGESETGTNAGAGDSADLAHADLDMQPMTIFAIHTRNSDSHDVNLIDDKQGTTNSRFNDYNEKDIGITFRKNTLTSDEVSFTNVDLNSLAKNGENVDDVKTDSTDV